MLHVDEKDIRGRSSISLSPPTCASERGVSARKSRSGHHLPGAPVHRCRELPQNPLKPRKRPRCSGGFNRFRQLLALVVQDYALLTIGSVTVAYAGVYAIFGVLLWRFSRPSTYRPVLVAMLWTVIEFVKSIGYLAYPWGLIAYPLNEVLPLIQQSMWLVSGSLVSGPPSRML